MMIIPILIFYTPQKKVGEYEKEVEYLNKKIKELEEELKEYKPNPMPELTVGMFGKVFSQDLNCFDYFVVTNSNLGLIMVYENGEYDDADIFDEFGKAYIWDSVSAEIVELYTPWVKSFMLAKTVDEKSLDDNILWKIQLFTFSLNYGIIIIEGKGKELIS